MFMVEILVKYLSLMSINATWDAHSSKLKWIVREKHK